MVADTNVFVTLPMTISLSAVSGLRPSRSTPLLPAQTTWPSRTTEKVAPYVPAPMRAASRAAWNWIDELALAVGRAVEGAETTRPGRDGGRSGSTRGDPPTIGDTGWLAGVTAPPRTLPGSSARVGACVSSGERLTITASPVAAAIARRPPRAGGRGVLPLADTARA